MALRVPTTALVKLLAEGNFANLLDRALRQVYEHFKSQSVDIESDLRETGQPIPASRKRKREPSFDEKPDFLLPIELTHTLAKIWQATLADAPDKNPKTRLALKTSSAAALVESILQVQVLASIQTKLPGTDHESRASILGAHFPEQIELIVNVWNSRIGDIIPQDVGHEDVLFVKHCLPDIVEMLQAREKFDLDHVARIECLIAKHAILPARVRFLRSDTGRQQNPPSDDTIELIRQGFAPKNELKRGCINTIYNIATRVAPRDSVRRKQSEDGWLNALLIGLCNRNADYQDVQACLEIAVEKHVTLSSETLHYMAGFVPYEEPAQSQIDFMSLLMRINASAFVPPRGPSENELLVKLLKISEGILDKSLIEKEDLLDFDHLSTETSSRLVIPLLQAYNKDRGLDDFMQLWQRQLDRAHSLARKCEIWDDDDVLKAFASCVNETMSAKPFERFLSDLAKNGFKTGSQLIVLDALMLANRPAMWSDKNILERIQTTLVNTKFAPEESYRGARSLRGCVLLRGTEYPSDMPKFRGPWNLLVEDKDQRIEWFDYALLVQEVETMVSSALGIRMPAAEAGTERASQKMVFGSISTSLLALADNDVDQIGQTWDGKMRHLDSKFETLQAILAVIARTQDFWKLDTPERRELLRAFRLVAVNKAAALQPFRKLWDDFRKSGIALTNKWVLQAIYPLEDFLSLYKCGDNDVAYLDELLQDAPLNDAEDFKESLNLLVDYLMQNIEKSIITQRRESGLALLARMFKTGKVGAGQAKNWRAGMELLRDVLKEAKATDKCLILNCTKIFRILWARLLTSKDVEGGQYLRDCWKWVTTQADAASNSGHHIFLDLAIKQFFDDQDSLGSIVNKKSIGKRQLEVMRSRNPAANPQEEMLEGSTLSIPLKQLEDMSKSSNTNLGKDYGNIKACTRAAFTGVQSMTTDLVFELTKEIGKTLEHRALTQAEYMMALACVYKLDSLEGQFSEVEAMLATRFTAALSSHSPRSIHNIVPWSECVEGLVSKFAHTVNQNIIDSIFSTVSNLLSADCTFTGMELERSFSIVIFDRVCSLCELLVSRQRKRLGGRYHLLLPVLQQLLRCLYSSTSQARVTNTHLKESLPVWMREPLEALGTRSVSQYTRLLTSVCDPTASSVSRKYGKPGAELNDATTKARNQAGQYMQYVIMEYAQCQLKGQISPEGKSALMPGLYAILDVMSRDVMRAMNAAMDSSSRAIFKALYDDYRRFGKWDKS